jgi:hypothetical protein
VDVAWHEAYRFHAKDEPAVTGFVYRRKAILHGGVGEEGWVAVIDGSDIQVQGAQRRQVVKEAVIRARAGAHPDRQLTGG